MVAFRVLVLTMTVAMASGQSGDGSSGDENDELTANDWRKVEYQSLLAARADPGNPTKKQAWAAAHAARGQQESEEAEEAEAAAQVKYEEECKLTNGVAVHCALGDWKMNEGTACSNSTCDSGHGVLRVRSRPVTVQNLCGGDACGPTTEVLACPAVPSCLLSRPQHTRVSYFMAGLDTATYAANKGTVHAAVKQHVSNSLKDTPQFQLKLRSHNTDATPTEPSLRRRRELASADTDTELDFDVITEGPNDAVAAALDAADAADLLALVTASSELKGTVTALYASSSACSLVGAGCAGTVCGWAVNSCGDQQWCGDCGLDAGCGGDALAQCINDGDCSYLDGAVDADGTLDGCLKDTSQL